MVFGRKKFLVLGKEYHLIEECGRDRKNYVEGKEVLADTIGPPFTRTYVLNPTGFDKNDLKSSNFTLANLGLGSSRNTLTLTELIHLSLEDCAKEKEIPDRATGFKIIYKNRSIESEPLISGDFIENFRSYRIVFQFCEHRFVRSKKNKTKSRKDQKGGDEKGPKDL